MPALTVIHTNDTHGWFARPQWDQPALAPPLRALMADYPGALLFDAGDAASAGNLGFRPMGEPALAVMSDLGYDAMCLGNRESHPRREIFPLKLSQARFPVLSANALAKAGAPLPVKPHVLIERGGVRIAVFCVTVPMFTRKQWSQPLCDYWFGDPIETARRQAAELRPRADVLIALTHVGYRQDQAL